MSERKETRFIVVHCSATAPHQDIGASDINDWHKARGFKGIGYHRVIRRDGSLEYGRKTADVGAHVKGYNRVSVGVCLVGGIDAAGNAENNFTPRQMRRLQVVLAGLQQTYPDAEILGHRDLSPDLDGDGKVERHEWLKECPCFDVPAWHAKITGKVSNEDTEPADADDPRTAGGWHPPEPAPPENAD